MSELQTNNESLVHTRQMSRSDFAALGYKDPSTIYFVNLTGVFTEQSLGEDGDIYLGSKLLTGQPDLTGLMRVDGTAHPLNDFTGTNFVEEFVLSSELSEADILDFFLHVSMKHTNSTAVDVECWLETGHYVEDEGQLKYCTDFVVASAQTSIPASRNSGPISGHLNLAGTLGGPIESKFIRICFSASGSISVIRHTDTNNVDRASQVLIRVYKTVKS